MTLNNQTVYIIQLKLSKYYITILLYSASMLCVKTKSDEAFTKGKISYALARIHKVVRNKINF